LFFSYFACVMLMSLALYGLWQLARDVWQACFRGGLQYSFPVSLLVVVRDSQEQIEGIVRSLLVETADDLKWCELVVIDHASEDITPAILDRLATAESRIRVVHMPAAARPAAEGITFCKGEIICLLDFINRLKPEDFPAVIHKLRQF
jgi:hypothetical protein